MLYSSGLHSAIRNKTGSRAAANTSWLLTSSSKSGHVCWNHNFCNGKNCKQTADKCKQTCFTLGMYGKTWVRVVRKNWAFWLGSFIPIMSKNCNAWTAGSLKNKQHGVFVYISIYLFTKYLRCWYDKFDYIHKFYNR